MRLPSRRTLVALIAAALVILAVAMLYWMPPAQDAHPVRDAVLALDTRDVTWSETVIPVHTQGRVRARHQLPLSLEVAGRVQEVSPVFADGGRVMAGDILLRLDPEPFQLEVTAQQNAVQAAQLHLAETRARARVAGGSSRSSALGRFEPQMDEARSRLAAARAGLRQAERQLEQTELVASISGRLKDVRVMPGQHVQAGAVLAELYQEDLVEIRLPVRDDWLALLGIVPGDESTLEPVNAILRGRFAGRDGQWQGQVVRREGGLNRNQMMHLIVQVANHAHDLPLEPGVLVEAELRGAPMPAVAVLPRSAQAGEHSIWVLDEEKRLRRQTVSVLHHDRDHLYLHDGVTRTTRAVLAGDLQLLEGMRIDPNPTAPGLANVSPLQP